MINMALGLFGTSGFALFTSPTNTPLHALDADMRKRVVEIRVLDLGSAIFWNSV